MAMKDTKESLRAEFDLAMKNWDFLIHEDNSLENEKKTQLTLSSMFFVGSLVAAINVATSSLDFNYKIVAFSIIVVAFIIVYVRVISILNRICAKQSGVFWTNYDKYCKRSQDIINKMKKVRK